MVGWQLQNRFPPGCVCARGSFSVTIDIRKKPHEEGAGPSRGQSRAKARGGGAAQRETRNPAAADRGR